MKGNYSLDTTILQSNTGIDLIKYIGEQRKIILKFINGERVSDKECKEISSSFEKIMTKHTYALHRRIGRIPFEKSFVDDE